MLKKIGHFLLWLVWDLPGFRLVWYKIKPPMEADIKGKPSTFAPWVIGLLGLYTVIFGIASQRYENRIDIIENRANAIFTQLGTSIYKKALGQIPDVQQMRCAVKPELMKPSTIWQSLFWPDTMYYTEIVEHLKETVESWKDTLNNVNLSRADLRGADLSGANLREANLFEADLSRANLFGAVLIKADLSWAALREAVLSDADLSEANISGADLGEANLSWADLIMANLFEANLYQADLSGAVLISADLSGANLWEVKNLTIEQLSEVKTLYKAKLDSALMEQVKRDYPHLLEGPEDE